MACSLLCDKGKEAGVLSFQLVCLLLDIVVVLLKLFFVHCEVVLDFSDLGPGLVLLLYAHFVEGKHTSANIEYQCASEAKIVLPLSIFIMPIFFDIVSTSLSCASSPSSASSRTLSVSS